MSLGALLCGLTGQTYRPSVGCFPRVFTTVPDTETACERLLRETGYSFRVLAQQIILAASPSLPGSVRALARYRLSDDEPLYDLDNPEQLQALRLRPSEVVSRDHTRTRAWVRRIYDQHRWIGARWWSYDPRWLSVGFWDTSD